MPGSVDSHGLHVSILMADPLVLFALKKLLHGHTGDQKSLLACLISISASPRDFKSKQVSTL